jgi:predicted metal-binding membrane protein
MAGAFQCSAWKARHLARCRQSSWPGDAAAAWRAGLHLGLHCNYCCAGLTSILVAVGIMDLRAMVLITAAITAERLAPDGVRIARVTGMVAVVVGCVLIAQAS